MSKSLKVIFVILAIIIFGFGWLLVSYDQRHQTLRLIAEMPRVTFYILVRKSVASRDFTTANVWLERQLSLSQRMFSGQGTLVPGLIANTKYVFERAYLKPEYEKLLPYLRRLSKAYPLYYRPQIWLALAVMQSDPLEALDAANRAIELAKGEARPYRLAISASLRLGDEALAKEYCKRYASAKGGVGHPYEYNKLFNGDQLRGVLIEAVDMNGDSHLSKNQGLTFDGKAEYRFIFDEAIHIKRLKVFVSSMPGVSFRIEDLKFAESGVWRVFDMRAVNLIPQAGFYIDEDWLMSTTGDAVGVEFLAPDGFDRSDTVALSATFRREPLMLPRVCGS